MIKFLFCPASNTNAVIALALAKIFADSAKSCKMLVLIPYLRHALGRKYAGKFFRQYLGYATGGYKTHAFMKSVTFISSKDF